MSNMILYIMLFATFVIVLFATALIYFEIKENRQEKCPCAYIQYYNHEWPWSCHIKYYNHEWPWYLYSAREVYDRNKKLTYAACFRVIVKEKSKSEKFKDRWIDVQKGA